jgi:hypothetical protein
MKISLRFVVRKRGAASGWEDEAFRFLLLEDMTKTTSVQAIVGNLNVVDGRELGFLPYLSAPNATNYVRNVWVR